MIQEELARYIEAKGIKQSVIADKCGMTPQAVSQSMRGERKLTVDEFAAVCAFIGSSMDDFNVEG